MQFRRPLIALVCCLTLTTAYADEGREQDRPGFLGRVARSLNPFKSRSSEDKLERGSAPKWKDLEMSIDLEPLPVKLPETRQIKVRIKLQNRSKKFVQMQFPTSQRIEVLVRTKDGKLVEQWSQDQSFANEPTVVVINPRERLEYTASVATRDMTIGETYVIEAFFPNYEPLRVQKAVTPEQ